ncbi:fimbrial protein [Stenotrophomonas maltophilia]|jgi:type 1 fimbria pilin|uniref:fimbrial protein n=1 Tax=Stenotrophomonas maltophilia TaxID=40324 RepID=UPI001313D0E2|nr:fimbrial protein [Stenotrophomonas maltophilia]MBN4995667.1 type 1 fimbrial protein [Stenotrophomonas maltophilia]MCO7501197.1 fimbrial protein [Stenotrophomonas maltophilia]
MKFHLPRPLALPALLLSCAAFDAQAACRLLGGDTFIDHEFDVAFVPDLHRPLASVQGSLKFVCDSAGETYGTIVPSLLGLSYIGDVYNEANLTMTAAYAMGPESALLMFRFESLSYIECPPGDDCPIEEGQAGGYSLRDGRGEPLDRMGSGREGEVLVWVDVYSRGGQMIATPKRSVGSTATMQSGNVGRHHLNIGVRFKAQTCAVTPQSVTLDPIDARTLDQQQSAGEKSFNVAVNCGASGRSLVLEMSDVHDVANTGDVLAPAPGSTTTGVALQVLQDGTPVRMQQPWSYGTTTGTVMSVPFSARYLRTPAELRTGSILGEVSLLADYY